MKKIYKVKFKECFFDTERSAYKVVNEEKLELEVESDGTLLIYEEDIQKAMKYGHGIVSLDYIGRVKEHTIAYIEELSSWHYKSSNVNKHPSFFK